MQLLLANGSEEERYNELVRLCGHVSILLGHFSILVYIISVML